MRKLAIYGVLVAVLGGLTWFVLERAASTGAPCIIQAPKTDMEKQACAAGGQDAMKQAMKAFDKQHGIKSCRQCHTTLAPSYELKSDAYEQFQKLGGR